MLSSEAMTMPAMSAAMAAASASFVAPTANTNTATSPNRRQK